MDNRQSIDYNKILEDSTFKSQFISFLKRHLNIKSGMFEAGLYFDNDLICKMNTLF